MRVCFFCYGDKKVDYGDGPEACHICGGSGEVEDYCYCSAYSADECSCGAWDNVEEF